MNETADRAEKSLRAATETWLQGRLSVLHKLALLILALTAPLAVAAVAFWSVTEDSTQTARRGLRALDQYESVWPLLVATARHEAFSAEDLARWRAAKAEIAADGIGDGAARLDAAIASADRAEIFRSAASLFGRISSRGTLIGDDNAAPTLYVWLAGVRLPALLGAADELAPEGQGESAALWRAAGRFEAVSVFAIGAARAAAIRPGETQTAIRDQGEVLAKLIGRATILAYERAGESEIDPARQAALLQTRSAMISTADDLWRLARVSAQTQLQAKVASISADRRIGLACWLAVLALISGLAVALARSIARPQNRLAETMTAMAGGLTDIHVPYQSYRNEIGDTARALEVFRNALIERKNLESDLQAERKALEKRVAERTREIEAANSAKTNFVASLAHEIRTPLNGVLGMAAALERTPLDQKQAGMVKIITSSGDVLLRLLTNAIDISRIESGKAELDLAPFKLKDLVEQAASLYRETADSKGIGLHVAVAPNADASYRGDVVRIRQILQNLISNAIKFTDSGGVSVSVSAASAPAGRIALTFEVADTGIGLPAQSVRLFESFSQGDRNVARRFGGAGLGLSICKQLAQLMGGSITAANRAGGGAVFRFEAPLEPETPQSLPSAAPLTALPSGLRALAADDNPVNLIVLRTLLAQLGIDADFANGGREALDAALSRAYDIVFLDVNMADLDGLAVTRTIRATDGPNRRTPIVALSADTMPAQIARQLTAGATVHVAKPIQVEALTSAIAGALSTAHGAPRADGAAAG